MTFGFGNPVQGPRIVPYLQPRTSRDVLPNGHPGFRVTQLFSTSNDVFNPGKPHLAIDIGNFYCGDKLVSMSSGKVHYLTDTSGALGVEILHGSGWRTQLWHISRWRVPNNSFVKRRGIWIADVGSTGLDIGGCHAHVCTISPGGSYVNPWLMLDQNQND